jgi:hypothetical protein
MRELNFNNLPLKTLDTHNTHTLSELSDHEQLQGQIQ